MSNDLKALIGRLNPICRRGLELAAGLCVQRGNYNVEVEHLLLKLAELPAIDLPPILGHYGVDAGELQRQLNQAIEAFDHGNHRTPAMSPQVVHLMREAWVRTSLILESELIRSSALLLALVEDARLRPSILDSCPILAHLPRDLLARDVRRMVRGSAEEKTSGAAPSAAGKPTAAAAGSAAASPPGGALPEEVPPTSPPQPNKVEPKKVPPTSKEVPPTSAAGESAAGDRPRRSAAVQAAPAGLEIESNGDSALGRFTIDLVAEARAGRIDPIVGRDEEIRQVTDVLCRRRQNNPILVGDAGVGKTAIAEGLALRVATSRVPEPFADLALRNLDLALLQAGAGVRGEFEQRLKAVISEVESSPTPVVLFIDEAHNLIGAGGREGRGDAANLLKPALARGTLRTIAATTWSEYKQHFEKDPALARRFQLVRVEEPDEEAAVEMLRGIVPALESHHGLEIDEKAVRDAVRLSRRYVADRRLPAKAVDVLDTASARVSLAGNGREVDSDAVAEVVSGWTGIPVGRLLASDIDGLLGLEERLAERIVGQPEALAAISRRVRTAFAGLEDPGKPRGVFLLAGDTGVGKTETAHALAAELFAGEASLVAINMTEFQEAHSVATLKGAPPGYEGFGRGGVLTEAVRRRPYCVVLLDEVEKAHPDVVELFFQVFDKGVLEDGEGLRVDFRHTVILLTTNLGGEVAARRAAASGQRPPAAELVEALRPPLRERFPPSLLGRLEIVPYYPLGRGELRQIVALKLAAVQERVRANHRAELTFDRELVDVLTDRCDESQNGAREIDRMLNQSLLPELSVRILRRMAEGRPFERVRVTVDEFGNFL